MHYAACFVRKALGTARGTVGRVKSDQSMPQITVRPFQESDREAFFHVRSMTYNDGRPIPPEDQVFKTTRGYVGEVDGTIAGVFSVLDFTCTRGAAVIKDAAVAGVAVLPEYRMSGVGSSMMSESLKLFRAEGIPMASLYAFRESYYRRFGYEACGSRVKISLPNHRYPKVEQSLPVRRLTLSEVGLLQPCYEEFSKRRSGMNIRSEGHWNRMIGANTSIYAAGDPVEAYATVNHQWQFWEGQSVSEFIWTTQRGYETMLGVLCGIGINKTAVEWYEPSDGPFLQRHFDQGVKANIERLVMYRVTDVPACLKAIKNRHKGEFTIRIIDDIIPENEGPWKVTFGVDGTTVEKTDQAKIEMPINVFTQAFLGEPSLADMARNGMICADPDTQHAMELFLPPSPTYCTDFF